MCCSGPTGEIMPLNQQIRRRLSSKICPPMSDRNIQNVYIAAMLALFVAIVVSVLMALT